MGVGSRAAQLLTASFRCLKERPSHIVPGAVLGRPPGRPCPGRTVLLLTAPWPCSWTRPAAQTRADACGRGPAPESVRCPRVGRGGRPRRRVDPPRRPVHTVRKRRSPNPNPSRSRTHASSLAKSGPIGPYRVWSMDAKENSSARRHRIQGIPSTMARTHTAQGAACRKPSRTLPCVEVERRVSRHKVESLRGFYNHQLRTVRSAERFPRIRACESLGPRHRGMEWRRLPGRTFCTRLRGLTVDNG